MEIWGKILYLDSIKENTTFTLLTTKIFLEQLFKYFFLEYCRANHKVKLCDIQQLVDSNTTKIFLKNAILRGIIQSTMNELQSKKSGKGLSDEQRLSALYKHSKKSVLKF